MSSMEDPGRENKKIVGFFVVRRLRSGQGPMGCFEEGLKHCLSLSHGKAAGYLQR